MLLLRLPRPSQFLLRELVLKKGTVYVFHIVSQPMHNSTAVHVKIGYFNTLRQNLIILANALLT